MRETNHFSPPSLPPSVWNKDVLKSERRCSICSPLGCSVSLWAAHPVAAVAPRDFSSVTDQLPRWACIPGSVFLNSSSTPWQAASMLWRIGFCLSLLHKAPRGLPSSTFKRLAPASRSSKWSHLWAEYLGNYATQIGHSRLNTMRKLIFFFFWGKEQPFGFFARGIMPPPNNCRKGTAHCWVEWIVCFSGHFGFSYKVSWSYFKSCCNGCSLKEEFSPLVLKQWRFQLYSGLSYILKLKGSVVSYKDTLLVLCKYRFGTNFNRTLVLFFFLHCILSWKEMNSVEYVVCLVN